MRLPTSAATEHEELVREMALIEKLSTQERLKLARKRRKEQLRRFFVRDRDGGGGVMGSRRLWRSATSVESHSAAEVSAGGAGCAGRRSVRFPDAVVLLEAAARNDVEEVGRLLSSGVNPDSTNEDGLTALHQCCIDDSVEMMTLLMDHGADVDAKDSERWTPLHAAATCGHLHLVSQLVNRGANLLSVNADGNMPYDICEEETTLEYIETQMARRGVTQELIERTRGHMEAAMLADLKSRPTDRLDERIGQHATPLHVAAANGYMSVLSYLLEQHVQVDARDADDWQAIHAAACWGHLPAIELLCQNGADLSAKTRGGETPFDVCEDSEIRDRLDQLRCEQEVQRRAAAAAADDGQRPRGVRRSQSTKHSIRRTSMRDKTLTPKKDVKQETQMRQSMDVMGDGVGLPGDVTLVDDIRVQLTSSSSGNDGDSSCSVDVDAPSVNRALAERTPKEQRNGAPLKSCSDLQQTNNNHDVTSHVHESATAACMASAALDDPAGKIDIHVHVTVNAPGAGIPSAHCDPVPLGNGDPPPSYATAASLGGTLADLKRQRALLRSSEHSGGSVCLTPFSPSLIIDGTATSNASAVQLDRSPREGGSFAQNSSLSAAGPRRRFVSSDSSAADTATGVGKRAPHVRKPNSGCCRMQ